MKQKQLSAAFSEAGMNMHRNSAAIPGRPGADYPSAGAGDPPGGNESALQMDALQIRQGRTKEGLSPTQQRLLGILADQRRTEETNRELAGALHTTEGAVEQQFNRIYRKFGVRSTRGLFRLLSAFKSKET